MFKTNYLVQSYIQKHKEALMQDTKYRSGIPEVSAVIEELKEMSQYYTTANQSQAEAAVSASHYIVGSIDVYGTFSISSNPAIHKSQHTANTEAKRLASTTPGKTFVVMQLSSGYRAGGILEF